MRTIHLADDKAGRHDAEVGFETVAARKAVRRVAPDGGACETVQILQSTMATSLDALRRETPDPVALGRRIAEGDPEVDVEFAGRRAEGLHSVWTTASGEVAYDVSLKLRVLGPDGAEKAVVDIPETPSNVALEDQPVRPSTLKSGEPVLVPKKDAIRQFWFSKSLVLRHVDGATYDFLRPLAEKLSAAKSMMRVRAGDGKDPRLVLTRNGPRYLGFLEGRVDGDKYLLVLHLTNQELKELPKPQPPPEESAKPGKPEKAEKRAKTAKTEEVPHG